MKQRTLDLILISKSRTRFNKDTPDIISVIEKYLSEMTKTPINYYKDNPERVHAIVKEAFYDFLDTCEKPSYFLRSYDRYLDDRLAKAMYSDSETNPTKAIMFVFAVADVREQNKDGSYSYVNGFDNTFDERIAALS